MLKSRYDPDQVEAAPAAGLPRIMSSTERRHWDRIPLSIPLFVRGMTPNGEIFLEFSAGLNVSAGGILLAMRRHLDPGVRLDLETPRSLTSEHHLIETTVKIHATVLRCTPDRRYFLVGVQFDKPLVEGRVMPREN